MAEEVKDITGLDRFVRRYGANWKEKSNAGKPKKPESLLRILISEQDPEVAKQIIEARHSDDLIPGVQLNGAYLGMLQFMINQLTREDFRLDVWKSRGQNLAETYGLKAVESLQGRGYLLCSREPRSREDETDSYYAYCDGCLERVEDPIIMILALGVNTGEILRTPPKVGKLDGTVNDYYALLTSALNLFYPVKPQMEIGSRRRR